jgi:hypothetical protein
MVVAMYNSVQLIHVNGSLIVNLGTSNVYGAMYNPVLDGVCAVSAN